MFATRVDESRAYRRRSIRSGVMILRDRQDERAVLDGLLKRARAGQGGVLVVRGEAGIGKTALLDYAIESASDLRMLRAVGVESEAELAFAALHQLCAPLLDRLERLPGPQRDALQTTFGLSAGPVPDRFFVGLGGARSAIRGGRGATSSLRGRRRAVAGPRFRPGAGVRGAQAAGGAGGDALRCAGARRGAPRACPSSRSRAYRGGRARELLRSVIPGRLDVRVADQIVAETAG